MAHPLHGEPQLLFITPLWHHVEVVIRHVHHVQAPGVTGIGVEYSAFGILVEHAYPGSFVAGKLHQAVVVVDLPLRQFLGCKGNVVIVVELVPERGYPLEGPTHPLAEGFELLKRCPGDRCQGHVSILEMDGDAVEIVRPERAALARLLPARTEHDVIDDGLGSPLATIYSALRAG